MVLAYVRGIPVKALVDTGATVSVLNDKIYRKVRLIGDMKEKRRRHTELFAADETPMQVTGDFEIELKLNGLRMPLIVSVVKNLGYDLLLGMDFFRATEAVVNVKTNTLDLLGGFMRVPMRAKNDLPLVVAAQTVKIPPMSEAVFLVKAKAKLPYGDFLIEGSPEAQCRSLMIARTLVKTPGVTYPCRALNPTERVITLKVGSPVGTIAAVKADKNFRNTLRSETEEPTLQEQLRQLTEKGITLHDTALVGEDRNKLIRMLYRNRDIMATTVAELPGTDIMMHRIDTGSSPPIRKRAYRYSPEDRMEIAKQTREMLQAGIIEESDTPWTSPVLLVTKKDGTKRFAIDFRALNEVTAMTSFPLPTFDDVLDTVADQRPTLWTSLDLRSGYWHVALDPETADRTGFQTHEGNFVFKRLPFGLCGGVQFFQMVMMKALRGLTTSSPSEHLPVWSTLTTF